MASRARSSILSSDEVKGQVDKLVELRGKII